MAGCIGNTALRPPAAGFLESAQHIIPGVRIYSRKEQVPFFGLSSCLSTSFHDFRFPRWYSSKLERPAEVLVMPAETCGKSEDLASNKIAWFAVDASQNATHQIHTYLYIYIYK